jgi:hypothetical protein
MLRVGAAIPAGSPYQQATCQPQGATCDPTLPVMKASQLAISRGSVTATLPLPLAPYSITLVS